jgi:hypothetical protein
MFPPTADKTCANLAVLEKGLVRRDWNEREAWNMVLSEGALGHCLVSSKLRRHPKEVLKLLTKTDGEDTKNKVMATANRQPTTFVILSTQQLNRTTD